MFTNSPLIAAVRDNEQIEKAIKSPLDVIFLLSSNINTLDSTIKNIKEHGKTVFVHADFVGGLTSDAFGIEFLASCGADGVLSTRANCIKYAKNFGLKNIQRFFVIDSLSVSTLVDSVKNTKPDMIEIMPGVIGGVLTQIKNKVAVPIIAGGLITSKQDVMTALKSGAVAVSTGFEQLWYI